MIASHLIKGKVDPYARNCMVGVNPLSKSGKKEKVYQASCKENTLTHCQGQAYLLLKFSVQDNTLQTDRINQL